MKKLFLIFALAVSASWVMAYEVGDMYIDSQTGVPAVVVYVDASGEHGLIMSPAGGYSKEKSINNEIKNRRNEKKTKSKLELKMYKSRLKQLGIDLSKADDYVAQSDELFETVMNWLPSMPLMYSSKINEKQERIMLRNVAEQMTGNGQQDQQMIIDYCEENDVNLPQYFYAIDWAQKLGVGWFIPGNNELELFASSLSKGLGVIMKTKEIDEAAMMFNLKTWMLSSIFPKHVRSSTFLESPWENIDNNKAKTSTIVRSGDLDFRDNYYVLGQGNNFGDVFYSLLKNDQYMGYIVAFKYF